MLLSMLTLINTSLIINLSSMVHLPNQTHALVNMTGMTVTNSSIRLISNASATPAQIILVDAVFTDSVVIFLGTFPSNAWINVQGCLFNQTKSGVPFGIKLIDWVLQNNSSATIASSQLIVFDYDFGLISLERNSLVVIRDNSSLAISTASALRGTVFVVSGKSVLTVSSQSSLSIASCLIVGAGALVTLTNSSSIVVDKRSSFSVKDSSASFLPDQGIPIPWLAVSANSTFIVSNHSLIELSSITASSVGIGLTINASTFAVVMNSTFALSNSNLSHTADSSFVIVDSNVSASGGSTIQMLQVKFFTNGFDAIRILRSNIIVAYSASFILATCTAVSNGKQLRPTGDMSALSLSLSELGVTHNSTFSIDRFAAGKVLPSISGDFSHVVLFESSTLSMSQGSQLRLSRSTWSTTEKTSVNILLLSGVMLSLVSKSFFIVEDINFTVLDMNIATEGGCMQLADSTITINDGSMWSIRRSSMNSGLAFSALALKNLKVDISGRSNWTVDSNNFTCAGSDTSPACMYVQLDALSCRNESIWSLAGDSHFVSTEGPDTQSGVDIVEGALIFVDSASEWITSGTNFSGMLFELGPSATISITNHSSWRFYNNSNFSLSLSSSRLDVSEGSRWVLDNMVAANYIRATASPLSFSSGSNWTIQAVKMLIPSHARVVSYTDPPVMIDDASTIQLANTSMWIIEDSVFVADTIYSQTSFQIQSNVSILDNSTWMIQRCSFSWKSGMGGSALEASGVLDISGTSAFVLQHSKFVSVGPTSLNFIGKLTFHSQSWLGIMSNTILTSQTPRTSQCLNFGTINTDDQSYITYVYNNCSASSMFDAKGGKGLTKYKCNQLNGEQQFSGYPDGAVSAGNCSDVDCNSEAECFEFLTTTAAGGCSYLVDQPQPTPSCSCVTGGVGNLCLPGIIKQSTSPVGPPAYVVSSLSRSYSPDPSRTRTDPLLQSTLLSTRTATITTATLLEKSMTPTRTSQSMSVSHGKGVSASSVGTDSLCLSSTTLTPEAEAVVPIRNIFSTQAKQAAATAVAASTVVAAVAGPSGASDVQAVSVLLLLPCVTGKQKSSGFGTLSPVALSDSAEGVLAGNAIACASMALVQLLALGFVHFIARKRKRPVIESMATVKFPAILLTTTASLFQGSIVVSISLLSQGSTSVSMPSAAAYAGGIAGLLWSLALPLVVVAAVRRVPRRFVRYIYHNRRSKFFKFRSLLPIGVILPRSVRAASSALICVVMAPSVLFAVIPFVSPMILAAVTLLPASASNAVCQTALWVSCALHAAVAAAVIVLGVHRAITTRALCAVGLLLTAVCHILIASHAPPSSTDTLMLIQSAVTILRCIVSFLQALTERKMRKAEGAVSVSSVPLWKIGDGGAAMEAEISIPGSTCDKRELEEGRTIGGDPECIRAASLLRSTATHEVQPMEPNDAYRTRGCSSSHQQDQRASSLLRRHDEKEMKEGLRSAATCLQELVGMYWRLNVSLNTEARGSLRVFEHGENKVRDALKLLISCIVHERRAQQARHRLENAEMN